MAGEQSCRKGSGGAGWQQAQHESPEGKPYHVCIKHSITSQAGEVTVPRYWALVQPPLEHCVHFWAPQFKKDMKVFKCTQRRAAKLLKGLEGISCEEAWRGQTIKLDGHRRSLPSEIVYLRIKYLLDKFLYQILPFFTWELKSISPFHIRNEDKWKSTYICNLSEYFSKVVSDCEVQQ